MATPETPLEQLVSESHRPENRVRSWLRHIVTSDRIIALFTVVIAGVGYFQWSAIHDQWKEMHDAGRQTEQLIFLYAQQVEELQTQAEQTHELAVQAENQANAAQLSSITTLRMFQANRPWVVIDSVQTRAPTGGMTFAVVMVNDGTLAATQLVMGCDLYWDQKFVPVDEGNEIAKPVTMGPTDRSTICEGAYLGAKFEPLRNRTSTLVIVIHAAYKGPAGSYKYCDEQKYLPLINRFTNIGECKDPKNPLS